MVDPTLKFCKFRLQLDSLRLWNLKIYRTSTVVRLVGGGYPELSDELMALFVVSRSGGKHVVS